MPVREELTERLKLGLKRYNHGVRVDDDTQTWGTPKDSWMEMAKEDTKNAPRMLDSEARLDSTIGINKQFRYNLTMINWLESDPHVPAFKQRMLSEIRNYVCTAEKMKFFVSNDVPVTHAYFDKEGKQIAIITIKPTDCASSVPDLFIY